MDSMYRPLRMPFLACVRISWAGMCVTPLLNSARRCCGALVSAGRVGADGLGVWVRDLPLLTFPAYVYSSRRAGRPAKVGTLAFWVLGVRSTVVPVVEDEKEREVVEEGKVATEPMETVEGWEVATEPMETVEGWEVAVVDGEKANLLEVLRVANLVQASGSQSSSQSLSWPTMMLMSSISSSRSGRGGGGRAQRLARSGAEIMRKVAGVGLGLGLSG
jgi:hypothetical protein